MASIILEQSELASEGIFLQRAAQEAVQFGKCRKSHLAGLQSILLADGGAQAVQRGKSHPGALQGFIPAAESADVVQRGKPHPEAPQKFLLVAGSVLAVQRGESRPRTLEGVIPPAETAEAVQCGKSHPVAFGGIIPQPKTEMRFSVASLILEHSKKFFLQPGMQM